MCKQQMKEEYVEWCIWFPLAHTFVASVGVSSGAHTQSQQVSFLVMEVLGEDAMPGFPGPSNELSRITSAN